jgi:hypothetical protein
VEVGVVLEAVTLHPVLTAEQVEAVVHAALLAIPAGVGQTTVVLQALTVLVEHPEADDEELDSDVVVNGLSVALPPPQTIENISPK